MDIYIQYIYLYHYFEAFIYTLCAVLELLRTAYKETANSSRELIFHAFRPAGSKNSVTIDVCNVAKKHIQADIDK